MVRLLRINLFFRVVCGSNNTLMATVYAARKSYKYWLAAVEDDFNWIRGRAHVMKENCFKCIDYVSRWVPFIRSDLSFWRRNVKSICLCMEANIMEHILSECPSMHVKDIFECNTCGANFPTHAQLQQHKFKKHGSIRLARDFVGVDNRCPACMRCYKTRTGAIRHIMNSSKCCDIPLVCEPELLETVEILDRAECDRIKVSKSSGIPDCCATNNRVVAEGPLLREFFHCYKGRPKQKREYMVM